MLLIMAITCPAWAGGASSAMLSIGGGVVLMAQAPSPQLPGGPTLLEGAGIASIIVGIITAIGTQLKPVIDGYFQDRRHKREMEALDMANDLAHANQRARELEKKVDALAALDAHKEAELAHLRAIAVNNEARIKGMLDHWNSPRPPEVHLEPVPPHPGPPPVSSDEILIPENIKGPNPS
jgi:hypothetical protein